MVARLAEEIYARAILLKKYNSKNLLFKKNRLALEEELHKIQNLTDDLLSKLDGNQNYSDKYKEFATFMINQLTECILLLDSKEKNYRKAVSRRIWGFHNLPRAFLSSKHTMKIPPEDAKECYETSLEFSINS